MTLDEVTAEPVTHLQGALEIYLSPNLVSVETGSI
jgi:hypothetical protein